MYIVSHFLFLQVAETTDRIDMEKLKKRDPIHFYDDVLLFEDELSDHGTSILSVKVVSNSNTIVIVITS